MPPDSAGLDAALAELMGKRVEAPRPDAGQALTVSEMAQPGSPPVTEEASAVDEPPVEVQPPASLKDLAEKSGLTVEELYALKLNDFDGESLSSFKDRVKELQQVDAARATVETERAGQRQERLRWTRELAAAKAAGLRDFTEQEKAQIGQLLQRHAENEAATIVAALPEWSNQATLKADFEGIASLLKPYGYAAEELARMLETDARLTLFLKEQLDQSRRLTKASEKVKAGPKKLVAPAGNAPKPDALQRVLNDPRSSKVDRGLAILMQQGAKK